MSEDDEPIALSSDTLNALREFQIEQESEKQRFAELQARAQTRFAAVQANEVDVPAIDDFKEDWQLSQFWYADETAESLARELVAEEGLDLRIGVLCAPSVYPHILKLKAQDAWLFEFDTRFEVLAGPKFVRYDYNHAMQFPAELKGTFDRLIIDPPFLSDECHVKAAMTARALAKADARIIVCSGAKMRSLCLRLYKARESRFEVKHKDGRLSNDFMCLMNYTSQNEKEFGLL